MDSYIDIGVCQVGYEIRNTRFNPFWYPSMFWVLGMCAILIKSSSSRRYWWVYLSLLDPWHCAVRFFAAGIYSLIRISSFGSLFQLFILTSAPFWQCGDWKGLGNLLISNKWDFNVATKRRADEGCVSRGGISRTAPNNLALSARIS